MGSDLAERTLRRHHSPSTSLLLAFREFKEAVSARPYGIAAVFLGVTLLSGGDLVEIIPYFSSLVAHPLFPFIHEAHDLLALMVALYAAYAFVPAVGSAAILWFLALHAPYFYLTYSQELPELLRLVLLVVAAVFGIDLLAQRNQFAHRLAYLATHDPLTDLPNRRHLREEMERQLAHSWRYGTGGGVLFLDLDEFKNVNDTLGHLVGDELLVSVADLLRTRMRDTDTLARLGGDEFAVVLLHTDAQEARVIAEHILEEVRNNTIVAGGQPVGVTASVGVALFPQDGATVEELLAHADIALYQAKGSGRNRVGVYPKDAERQTEFGSILRLRPRPPLSDQKPSTRSASS